MTLVSIEYFAFVIASLLIYYILPKRFQWIILLLASVSFFIFAGTPWTIVYPLAATLITWISAQRIQNEKTGKSIKALWLAVGLAADIGMLAALKYSNFFLGIVNSSFRVLNIGAKPLSVNWIAALGISFYTLQIVGYLLDCYWGIIKAQKNPFRLALFTMFFPQMVSGPISRYSQLGEQLYAEHKFNFSKIRSGAIRIIVGMFKKIVLAENLAPYVPKFLDSDFKNFGPVYIIGMVVYIIQIYADFSGCMDIITGTAECFDITVTENFNSPFLSKTIQEFWQRWHITLGLWLRDYVMYPLLRSKTWRKISKFCKKKLGKNAAKKIPTHLAMLVLWFCMGLWHGGGWNFILEGVWFWSVIVIGDWLTPLFKKATKKINTDGLIWTTFQRLRTILIYGIGALMFRSGSVKECGVLLHKMFSPGWIIHFSEMYSAVYNIIFTHGLIETLADITVIMFIFAIFVIIRHFENKNGSISSALENRPVMFRPMILVFLIFVIAVFGVYGSTYNAADFIYGGF